MVGKITSNTNWVVALLILKWHKWLLKESLYPILGNWLGMSEPKDGRPIFFPQKLVLLGNLALFVWIILDAIAFLLFDLAVGIVFFLATLGLSLWFTASSGLSASMLQLHKMHSRHGTLGSIILWQTHLQRLQIQLQTAHSNNLHAVYRGVSSNIRALLCTHRFHSRQSSGFCGSFSVYNL